MGTYVVVGIAGVVVVLLLLGCVLVFPRRAAPDLAADELTAVKVEKDRLALQADRLKLRNDVRSSLLQSLVQGVGGAALVVGLIFTWFQLQDNRTQLASQQDLTRRGQIADRFTKAVDQLGNSGSPDVRLGGIYGLEQVARDSHDDRIRLAVYEVLTAYVRKHAAWDPNSPPLDAEDPMVALQRRKPDVQAVITVLGRRDFSLGDPILDLSDTDLRNANLRIADLRRTFMVDAHLEGADLFDAHVEAANLSGAHLEGADLFGAHVESANLTAAHLAGANLTAAHLEYAQLQDADLSTARNLELAVLTRAHANANTKWPAGFDWQRATSGPAPGPIRGPTRMPPRLAPGSFRATPHHPAL